MNKYEAEHRELTVQVTHCLPLIETERAAYIKAEHGRLAAIIGTGYWNKEIEDFEIFHGRKGDELALIDDRPHDPYAITVEEMYWITQQYKRIERCGTETYTLFFNMMPEEKARFKLLSTMWRKLTHGQLVSEEELRQLDEGHDKFIDDKLTDPVKVVGNIEFDKEPDGGLNGGFNFNNSY
ncbi:MAG: hypothetical protein IJ109_03090 [Firmicutes bacterium]|nr:hypothetical protein [Bacillota bacterium]